MSESSNKQKSSASFTQADSAPSSTDVSTSAVQKSPAYGTMKRRSSFDDASASGTGSVIPGTGSGPLVDTGMRKKHASGGSIGKKKRGGRQKTYRQGSSGTDLHANGGQYSVGTWAHKTTQNLSPSLLEEVLNEKKMALFKSPEVIQNLQIIQAEVRSRKLETLAAMRGDAIKSSTARENGSNCAGNAPKRAEKGSKSEDIKDSIKELITHKGT